MRTLKDGVGMRQLRYRTNRNKMNGRVIRIVIVRGENFLREDLRKPKDQ